MGYCSTCEEEFDNLFEHLNSAKHIEAFLLRKTESLAKLPKLIKKKPSRTSPTKPGSTRTKERLVSRHKDDRKK